MEELIVSVAVSYYLLYASLKAKHRPYTHILLPVGPRQGRPSIFFNY
jgi:hypothetical protein